MNNIEVKDLNFAYENSLHKHSDTHHLVLKNINLNLKGSQSVGIIGANGVGKSTLLKLLVGLELNYQGSILINNTPANKKNLSKIREKTAYIFQDSDNHLFMPTVYEDVAFAPRNYGYSKEEIEKRVNTALETVQISHLRDAQIYRLSGGQKKMACIAGVLAMQPDCILADEPSVGLDPQNRRRLISVFNQLNILKLIASNDLDLIYDCCERTVLLAKGKIIADANSKEILKDKKLLEANGLELPLSLSRI